MFIDIQYLLYITVNNVIIVYPNFPLYFIITMKLIIYLSFCMITGGTGWLQSLS